MGCVLYKWAYYIRIFTGNCSVWNKYIIVFGISTIICKKSCIPDEKFQRPADRSVKPLIFDSVTACMQRSSYNQCAHHIHQMPPFNQINHSVVHSRSYLTHHLKSNFPTKCTCSDLYMSQRAASNTFHVKTHDISIILRQITVLLNNKTDQHTAIGRLK